MANLPPVSRPCAVPSRSRLYLLTLAFPLLFGCGNAGDTFIGLEGTIREADGTPMANATTQYGGEPTDGLGHYFALWHSGPPGNCTGASYTPDWPSAVIQFYPRESRDWVAQVSIQYCHGDDYTLHQDVTLMEDLSFEEGGDTVTASFDPRAKPYSKNVCFTDANVCGPLASQEHRILIPTSALEDFAYDVIVSTDAGSPLTRHQRGTWYALQRRKTGPRQTRVPVSRGATCFMDGQPVAPPCPWTDGALESGGNLFPTGTHELVISWTLPRVLTEAVLRAVTVVDQQSRWVATPVTIEGSSDGTTWAPFTGFKSIASTELGGPYSYTHPVQFDPNAGPVTQVRLRVAPPYSFSKADELSFF